MLDWEKSCPAQRQKKVDAMAERKNVMLNQDVIVFILSKFIE